MRPRGIPSRGSRTSPSPSLALPDSHVDLFVGLLAVEVHVLLAHPHQAVANLEHASVVLADLVALFDDVALARRIDHQRATLVAAPHHPRHLELREVVLLERALDRLVVLLQSIQDEGAERIAATGRVVDEAHRGVAHPRAAGLGGGALLGMLGGQLERRHLLLLLHHQGALLLEVGGGRPHGLPRAARRCEQRHAERERPRECNRTLHHAPPPAARRPFGAALPFCAPPGLPFGAALGSTSGSGSGSTKRNVVAFPSTASRVLADDSFLIVISSSEMFTIRGRRAS